MVECHDSGRLEDVSGGSTITIDDDSILTAWVRPLNGRGRWSEQENLCVPLKEIRHYWVGRPGLLLPEFHLPDDLGEKLVLWVDNRKTPYYVSRFGRLTHREDFVKAMEAAGVPRLDYPNPNPNNAAYILGSLLVSGSCFYFGYTNFLPLIAAFLGVIGAVREHRTKGKTRWFWLGCLAIGFAAAWIVMMVASSYPTLT
jgi:hypothetical protein